jgi:hypothetical protein
MRWRVWRFVLVIRRGRIVFTLIPERFSSADPLVWTRPKNWKQALEVSAHQDR